MHRKSSVSLLEAHPVLASEWSPHNEKGPGEVSVGSKFKATWVCEKGHEWEASVQGRTGRGHGCPFCQGNRVLPGFNDLATKNPTLAKEWHPLKNDLDPSLVTSNSTRKAWWRCEQGHEWQASVGNRASKQAGCPYCSGRYVVPGETDLKTLNPLLAREWHPLKNKLEPTEVAPFSMKKVWWLCGLGHEWEAVLSNRSHGKASCPYCANKKVLPGFNDLATRFPEVAKEWHPTKNTVEPSQVMPGTKSKAWWLCADCGWEWETSVRFRTGKGSGCRSCRGRKVGLKRSGNPFPQWAKVQWSPKNKLDIEEYSPNSGYRATWECNKGHEWQLTVSDRINRETGCKQCGNGGTSRGEQDLSAYVESLGVEVRNHHRQINPNYEFDITVPDRKIAIEYNGLYWHSEDKKGRNYHRDKTLAAQAAGWQVIHVWEDDWMERPNVVKKMLAHKLGVSNAPKLNARSLNLRDVSVAEARKFLDANHIQGYVGGSVRIGLYDQAGALQAIMLFRSRGSGKWELNRYATDAIVRGGFSKLLKAFLRRERPAEVVSFSDHVVSDGGLYEASGFEKDGELAPDYVYRVGARREHKFNYRLKRFRTDPTLEYVEGMTERELAALNGLDRIYDAGKTRWVLKV